MGHFKLQKLEEFLDRNETIHEVGEIGNEAYLFTENRIFIYDKDGWIYEFYPEEIIMEPLRIKGKEYLHIDYLKSYDYFFEDLGKKAKELSERFQYYFGG